MRRVGHLVVLIALALAAPALCGCFTYWDSGVCPGKSFAAYTGKWALQDSGPLNNDGTVQRVICSEMPMGITVEATFFNPLQPHLPVVQYVAG